MTQQMFKTSAAAFGPWYPLNGTAKLVESCEALSINLTAQIAITRRGNCSFVSKVRRVQNAGAIALVVVNNGDVTPTLMACPFGEDCTDIQIPSVLVPMEAMDAINDALEMGPNEELFNLICGSRKYSKSSTIYNCNFLCLLIYQRFFNGIRMN